MSVPLVDLRAAHLEIEQEIVGGFAQVLASAAFIKGPEVRDFEQEFAHFSGTRHAIGVANGTDAVELALRAAELAPGAEVVVPANTFVATAAAVVRAGLRPVFADVDPEYLLLDPASAAKAITAATGAVMPVHLYGQMAPMQALAETATAHDVVILEDAAQSHGASQGGRTPASRGLAAGVSFYPGKNLGAYGDAGAVLTHSDAVARKVRLLGDHGSERKYVHQELGFNSRMDALQAVVLRAKLRRLEAWNEQRRCAARRYDELLADLDDVVLPQTAPGNTHVWHLYVVQVPRRDHVMQVLQDLGIQAAIHYPVVVPLQPAFRRYGYCPGDFPIAEAAARRILSLPIYPQITPDQQRAVVDALRRALRSSPPAN